MGCISACTAMPRLSYALAWLHGHPRQALVVYVVQLHAQLCFLKGGLFLYKLSLPKTPSAGHGVLCGHRGCGRSLMATAALGGPLCQLK